MLLLDHISALPREQMVYYLNSGMFVIWANQLLEELSGRKVLPEVRKEYGALVKNKFWIDKPLQLIKLNEVFDPLNYLHKFRVIDTNEKLKMIDEYIEEDENAITIENVFNGSTDHIECNLTGYEEDELANYLLVIPSGLYEGRTFVLSGNGESSCGTRLNYLHELSSALDTSEIDADTAILISPEHYVMVDCVVAFDMISANSDEFPIDDKYERRLVPAWLRWKVEEDTNAVSSETIYWAGKVEKILNKIDGELAPRVNKAKGRRLIGFER
jgi:hypothetical protein